jgi:hypothetical protein
MLAAPAFAVNAKKCKADCKNATDMVRKQCEGQMKKRNGPKGGCEQALKDFTKQCEAACDKPKK